MGRPLRYIPPGGAVVEVTNRTIQGRHLLRPTSEFNEVCLGVLARAQEISGVRIHFYVVLSNHLHLILWVESAQQLARFCWYFFGNLAREVCKLHNWKDKVWAQRYRSVVVTEEVIAGLGRLRYSIANGCKEGLVSSPLDWPGPHAAQPLSQGVTEIHGAWINRTGWHRARAAGARVCLDAFREAVTVRLSPLPCVRQLPRTRYFELICGMVDEVERETRNRARTTGSEPLGVEAVVSQNPHFRPSALKRSRAPLVHAASSGERRAYLRAYRWFVASYREAVRLLRESDFGVTFPQGAFLPTVRALPASGPLERATES